MSCPSRSPNGNTKRSPSCGRVTLGSSARAEPSMNENHSPSPRAAFNTTRRPWDTDPIPGPWTQRIERRPASVKWQRGKNYRFSRPSSRAFAPHPESRLDVREPRCDDRPGQHVRRSVGARPWATQRPGRGRSDHARAREFVGGRLGTRSPPARRRAGLRSSRSSEALRLRSRRRRGLHGHGGHPVALRRGGRRDGRGDPGWTGARPRSGYPGGGGPPGVRDARRHPDRPPQDGLRGWLRVRAHVIRCEPEPGAPRGRTGVGEEGLRVPHGDGGLGSERPEMGQGFALFAGVAPEIIRASAREAEGLGYSSFWVNHPGATDGLVALALAATETRRVELGIGVIPLHTRGPDSIGQGVRANRLPLDRLLLAVGSANPGALQRVRDGVAALRPNLAARLVVAALGPQMCRVAGEVGDGVLFNWLTPEYARRSADWVRAGAAAAGRQPPRLFPDGRVAPGAGAGGRPGGRGAPAGGGPADAAHPA